MESDTQIHCHPNIGGYIVLLHGLATVGLGRALRRLGEGVMLIMPGGDNDFFIIISSVIYLFV